MMAATGPAPTAKAELGVRATASCTVLMAFGLALNAQEARAIEALTGSPFLQPAADSTPDAMAEPGTEVPAETAAPWLRRGKAAATEQPGAPMRTVWGTGIT